MKIHEYQGKEILRKFGVTVPRGIPCMSVEEAVKAAETLGGPVWVVKAQIHAGGRGKGGGVKVAKSLEQVKEFSNQIPVFEGPGVSVGMFFAARFSDDVIEEIPPGDGIFQKICEISL